MAIRAFGSMGKVRIGSKEIAEGVFERAIGEVLKDEVQSCGSDYVRTG